MAAVPSHSTVKIVDAKGEEREPGVLIVRNATVIPGNERWLQEPQARADLQAALAWAASHPASDSQADDVLNRLTQSER